MHDVENVDDVDGERPESRLSGYVSADPRLWLNVLCKASAWAVLAMQPMR